MIRFEVNNSNGLVKIGKQFFVNSGINHPLTKENKVSAVFSVDSTEGTNLDELEKQGNVVRVSEKLEQVAVAVAAPVVAEPVEEVQKKLPLGVDRRKSNKE